MEAMLTSYSNRLPVLDISLYFDGFGGESGRNDLVESFEGVKSFESVHAIVDGHSWLHRFFEWGDSGQR